MPASAPLDTDAFLNEVIKLLQGFPEIAGVFKGAPNSVGTRVAAYVTAAHQELNQKAVNRQGGYWHRWAWALVVFCYRITEAGPVSEAEGQLARYLDRLFLEVYGQREPEDALLGGVVQDVQLDLLISRMPEYQPRSGQEFREYACMIGGLQTHVFGAS